MPRFVKHFRLLLACLLFLGLGARFLPLGAAAGFESGNFEPFFFIDATDPHLTDDSARSNFRGLGVIANRIQAPFVLVGGDLSSINLPGNWSGWESCLSAFTMPLKPIPGNHDVFSTATLEAYRAHFGSDYYSFTYNNCAFICLNSIILREPDAYPADYQEAWRWLEAALQEASAAQRRRIFILLHHPPYSNWYDEANTYYNFPKTQRTRLLTLARNYHVSAILAGHQHYTFAYPEAAPPLYVTGGSAYVFDNKGIGFRVFKVLRRRVEQFFVRLDEADWLAPSRPGRPWVSGRTPSSLTLEWPPSSDNVGVLRYAVRRDGVLLGHALGETFSDTGLSAGETHRYTVAAIDLAGNISSESLELQASPDGPPKVAEPVLAGTGWRYLDGGVPAPVNWMQPDFDDQGWNLGLAQLGWGDGDEATTLTLAPRPAPPANLAPLSPMRAPGAPQAISRIEAVAAAPPVTVYFRRHFEVTDPAVLGAPTLQLLCGDGAVVYLNGTEAGRWNMPEGGVSSTTLALREISGGEENAWRELPLDRSLLVAGTNLVAVEVHQASPASPDLSFDLHLAASTARATTTLSRGPYLQDATTTAVTVRWRTATPVVSRVTCGVQPGLPAFVATDLAETTGHELRLAGLAPGTRYTYQVEAGTQVLAGGDGSCSFATPPPAGTVNPTRIWVLGDSGTGNLAARQVRDAYLQNTGARPTDLWLMLGDNAYPTGADADHQAGLFDIFPATLRTAALWPTLGNHETYSFVPGTTVHPYFDIFTLPAGGEAGGVPSGTEAYYSVTYGNIHLVCLDSCESDRSPGGPMLSWLKADLAATRARWLIAWFHHPPYSKGAHDSDDPFNEGDKQIAMRENALPILEAAGADLVLSGHSHSYERSCLIDGHYGYSSSLQPSMILNHGDGKSGGDGPYVKPLLRGPHQGTVYMVAGSSGQVTAGGTMNHPVMVKSLLTLGSVAIDINGRRLDARFIDNTGAIQDEFTIWKGQPVETAVRHWRGYR